MKSRNISAKSDVAIGEREMMTLEELMMLEDELADRGSECPHSPDLPSTEMDREWDAEYAKFCRERLVRLTAEDWVLALSHPNLQLLQSYASEYAARQDLTKLSAIDLVVLLTTAPELAEKCDLNTLDAEAWVNLIENHGELFADAKYGVYSEWVKADKKAALEHFHLDRSKE